MNYIFGYISTGLLITMFFEYIFKLVDKKGEETKFDSYWERLLLIIFLGINNISNYSQQNKKK